MVGVHYFVQIIRPSRFVCLWKCSKHTKKDAVETFHLSIPLRVVGCSSRVSNAAELVELGRKFVFKLPSSVVVSGLGILNQRVKSLYTFCAAVMADLFLVG